MNPCTVRWLIRKLLGSNHACVNYLFYKYIGKKDNIKMKNTFFHTYIITQRITWRLLFFKYKYIHFLFLMFGVTNRKPKITGLSVRCTSLA